MAINSNVLQAIMAMDAYNRGEAPGVKISGDLGNITLLDNVKDVDQLKSDALASGFSAQAYNWNGKIVIAYRGTDVPGTEGFWDDVFNGWATGLGSPETAQVELAIKFYNHVKNSNPGANIELTGHSLGGGLAGLVGKTGTPY